MTFKDRLNEITRNAQKLRYTRDDFKNRRVVYYGTGTQAVNSAPFSLYDGVNLVGFADSTKTGRLQIEVNGGQKSFPIIPPQALIDEYEDAIIVIAVMNPQFVTEIRKLLADFGVADDRVVTYNAFRLGREMAFSKDIAEYISKYEEMYNLFADEISKDIIVSRAAIISGYYAKIPLSGDVSSQYFDESVPGFVFAENEIFVDGGFFVGETLRRFYDYTNGKYRKYYAFELSKYNIELMKQGFLGYSGITESAKPLLADTRVELINKGMYSHTTTLKTNLKNTASTSIMVGGGMRIVSLSLSMSFSLTKI
jgi:hypothetical protein